MMPDSCFASSRRSPKRYICGKVQEVLVPNSSTAPGKLKIMPIETENAKAEVARSKAKASSTHPLDGFTIKLQVCGTRNFSFPMRCISLL